MTPEKILEMLPKKITTYVLNVDGIMLREDCLENRIRNATIDDCANALAGKVVAKEDLLTAKKNGIFGCHSYLDLRNMLEDVVNELDLSEGMLEKHGQMGTPPAELVKLILAVKDLKIKLLEKKFTQIDAQQRKPNREKV